MNNAGTSVLNILQGTSSALKNSSLFLTLWFHSWEGVNFELFNIYICESLKTTKVTRMAKQWKNTKFHVNCDYK